MEYQSDFFDDVRKMFAETDRRQQETALQMKETDLKLKELGKHIGGLGGRLGDFVEWTIKPGLVRIFKGRGIGVCETLRDLESERNGEATQVDLLVVNDTEAVVVEVKSRLEARDVDEHLERLEKFKRLFPRYSDARLMGAVAAVVLPSDSIRYAERKGLFVIGQKGEDAAILNTEGFEPKTW